MTTDKCESLLAYNAWANRRIMDQIKTLPHDEFTQELGGSFPSLKLTIMHMMEADWLWLNRWQNLPPAPAPTNRDTTSADSIDRIWQDILDRSLAIFQSDSIGSTEDPLNFLTKRGDPYSMPLWQTVYHAVNHSTYHRGQITNMVRMLGHTPVGTDLFLFFGEQNQKAGS